MTAGDLEWSCDAWWQVEHDDVLIGVRTWMCWAVGLMNLKARSKVECRFHDGPNRGGLWGRLRQLNTVGRHVNLALCWWRRKSRWYLHRLNMVNVMLNVHRSRHLWRGSDMRFTRHHGTVQVYVVTWIARCWSNNCYRWRRGYLDERRVLAVQLRRHHFVSWLLKIGTNGLRILVKFLWIFHKIWLFVFGWNDDH